MARKSKASKPAPPPAAVGFDFDGTWTDKTGTDALVHLVNVKALKPRATRELLLLKEKYFVRAQRGELPVELQRRWMEETVEAYVRHRLHLPDAYRHLDTVDLRPGVRTCAHWLHGHGIPVPIISYGVRQFIRRVLAKHGLLEPYVDAICAADVVSDPVSREVIGWHPATLVIPHNKGEWMDRVARKHGVPDERVFTVGDTAGDCFLGRIKRNRLGIAHDRKDARKIAKHFGHVVVTLDYAPVIDWLSDRLGLPPP